MHLKQKRETDQRYVYYSANSMHTKSKAVSYFSDFTVARNFLKSPASILINHENCALSSRIYNILLQSVFPFSRCDRHTEVWTLTDTEVLTLTDTEVWTL